MLGEIRRLVLLILEGYGLHEFVLGIINVPLQSIVDRDGNLVANADFLFHKQQDKLLASWLLSTICDDILVHLIGARSSFDVWNIVVQHFATKSTITVSTLRHPLYSQKKGQLTIKEHLAKIKSLCDTLMAAGNAISEQEQISIILTGLLVEYESIRVVASVMSVPLDLLTEMLTDWVVVLKHFEAEGGGLLITNINTSCVVELVTQSRSVTIDLMSILKVFLIRQCKYTVIRFKILQDHHVKALIVVSKGTLCNILVCKLMLPLQKDSFPQAI
ncbi:hypothetical protein PVK06_009686 [Gossypium arboreum]|uniref:Uncharacterized protein n=1 Tax=Gossypium arboreum TaxID=29729 RepID=A0ABR0QPE9_GOSAR|nr:hypothetical protein PVK06_009686 [Gossypium arboreum]